MGITPAESRVHLHGGTGLYDFEVGYVAEEILRRKARRVLLQFPEGLRGEAFSIVQELDKRVEAELLVSGDPCYGACDLPLCRARTLGVDLIVHYGHSPMLRNTNPPVLYVEARMGIDVEEVARRAIPLLGEYKTVGLASTVQHLHQLSRAEGVLE
ncbi:MAG: diphthamide synthesis protein, partial [Candidatus Bathyarchaeia archaeon]